MLTAPCAMPTSSTPEQAAEARAVHALLNCALRESHAWTVATREDGFEEVLVPVLGGRGELRAALTYRSPTFRHLFALPVELAVGDGPARPVTLPMLTCLLADALAGEGGGAARPVRDDLLVARVLDSQAAIAQHLHARADDVARLWSPEPLGFVDTEQALLHGHQVHPTPKSRGEMSPDERRAYSPEVGARFALRWLAVHPDLALHDSAEAQPAPALVEAMVRDDPEVDHAALAAARGAVPEHVLVPAHPWQLAHLQADPRTAHLFTSGAVVDLGAFGGDVAPTSSVRTVHRAAWPWQLKFSLSVRVTNSMRVTLPKELGRAVEAARLARTEIGRRAAAAAPRFRAVHDPAYLSVAVDGQVCSELSVLLRENHWPTGATVDVSSLTALCQDHPYGGPSRLARIVQHLAATTGEPTADVARRWFAAFCDVAVVSLVRLYLDVGLCYEAHQQNTLLELDGGWPATCVYRDSQGYFHREAAHGDVTAVVPGAGERTESIFPEALADERLVYYLFTNLTLGVVNALGTGGCCDEEVLLADLRDVLAEQRALGGRYPATLLDRLLDDPTWPCKANLRTRLHDMDELVGDIATQSVYVTIPNPLRGLTP